MGTKTKTRTRIRKRKRLTHRYIGGKGAQLDPIRRLIQKQVPARSRILDGFSGPGTVSRALRQMGHEVVAVDQLATCRVLTARHLEFTQIPQFSDLPLIGRESSHSSANRGSCDSRLAAVIDYLNYMVPPTRGILADAFSLAGRPGRGYLSFRNGLRLDGIVATVHWWRLQGAIQEAEFVWLLAEILAATDRVLNTGPVQEAPLKKADPSMHDLLLLSLPPAGEYPNHMPVGQALHGDVAKLAADLGTFDVAYLDPPYGKHGRQYAATYHVSEAVALGGTNLLDHSLTPVGGKVPAEQRVKSGWSSDSLEVVRDAAEALFNQVNARHIVMSYAEGAVLDQPTLDSLLRTVWGAKEVTFWPVPRSQPAAVRAGNKVMTEWLIHAES